MQIQFSLSVYYGIMLKGDTLGGLDLQQWWFV